MPFSETVMSGKQVILTCEGESRPAPTVEWLKNNRKIADFNVETSGNFLKTSKLTIKEVKYEDNGDYSCVFINGGWKVSRTVKLIVYGRFDIIYELLIISKRLKAKEREV